MTTTRKLWDTVKPGEPLILRCAWRKAGRDAGRRPGFAV